MTVIISRKRFELFQTIRKATVRRLSRGTFPQGYRLRWTHRPGDTRSPINPHFKRSLLS